MLSKEDPFSGFFEEFSDMVQRIFPNVQSKLNEDPAFIGGGFFSPI